MRTPLIDNQESFSSASDEKNNEQQKGTVFEDSTSMKVLAAMRDVLRNQIIREKCVEIPYAGKFVLLDESTFRFMPTLELLTTGPFRLVENENNVSPLSKYSARFSNYHKLSLSQLSDKS